MAAKKDPREDALVDRVQRLERQRQRVRLLPTQKLRVARAKTLDGKIVQAKAELAAYRLSRARTPREKAANFLLDSPNTRFVFRSPTGGTARPSLEAQARGEKAYVAATGGSTDLSLDMLNALVEMAQAGVILINCLTNGRHVSGSNHYVGRAVDLDLTSSLGASRIEAIAGRHGGARNFETSHYHLDF